MSAITDMIVKLWIFFGFRIWGIGFVLGVTYFALTNAIPVLSEEEGAWLVGAWAVIWIGRSLYKLFTADSPGILEN
jgi:hypothetical protein